MARVRSCSDEGRIGEDRQPGGSIGEALGHVDGLAGQVAIGATNAFGGRSEQFESLALTEGVGGRFFYRYALPAEL